MKKQLMIFCTALVLAAAGCSSTDNSSVPVQSVTEEASSNVTEPSTADVSSVPFNTQKVTLSLAEWEHSNIAELFFGDIGSTEYEERKSDLVDDETQYFYDVNNHFLSVEKGNIMYRDVTEDNRFNYSMIAHSWNGSKDNKALRTDELSGFSLGAAKEKVDVLIERLGIKALDEPEIWSVNSERASAYMALYGGNVDKHGEALPPWSEDDECYVFLYRQGFGGVPLSEYNEYYVCALVNKREVVSFECRNIFDEAPVSSESAEIGTSESEAKEAAEKFLAESFDKETLHVSDMRLVYVPAEYDRTAEKSMIPAWEVFVPVGSGEYRSFHKYYVNALSGEIMNR